MKIRPTKLSVFGLFAPILFIGFAIAGCADKQQPEDFLARVGDRYFTSDELSKALAAGSVLQDSSDAARQLLEQWITTEVLYNEAERRGLKSDPVVKEQLEENERSIMTGALLELLFDEMSETVTQSDLENYYAQNRDQLTISEPFVRIRYASTISADSAETIVAAMELLTGVSNPDSVWTAYLDQSQELSEKEKLADAYYPIMQLTGSIPGLENALDIARPGDVVPFFESQGKYHVIQLVDRLETGSLPELDMIREFVRSRVEIESRKQMVTRQVQRLRNGATAREELEIRDIR